MPDEKVSRKQEKDYTPEVDALIPTLEGLAKEGKVQEALDKLAVMEKQTRNAADLNSTSRLLSLLPKLIYTLPPTLPSTSFPLLLSSLNAYSKKHGQLKEAVVKLVDGGMELLEPIRKGEGRVRRGYEREGGMGGGKGDRWLDLLECLRDITEGKIYLELQRARLTKSLASHHEELSQSAPAEKDGMDVTPEKSAPTDEEPSDSKTAAEMERAKRGKAVTVKDHLNAAADLMTDVQVETYSSMDRREKTEFILDQMRLESLRDQWNRVRVGGRKINRAFLKEKGNSDLKLRYYELIIQLALYEDKYLDACKAYQEVWDTEEVKSDPEKEKEAIESIIMFIVLAPYDNEQHDMLNKLYANTDLQKCVLHYELLKCFITKELMRWPGITAVYGPTLRQSSVFAPLGAGETGEDAGEKRWKALHQRVIEHNIRVIASYYTQITISRLTELLDLSAADAEKTLCKLVTEKIVKAKIDRPAGIIDFSPRRNADEVLNGWSGDLSKMLGLIEKTSHLINKEYAIHAARAAAASA